MKLASVLLLAFSLHAQEFEAASIKPAPNFGALRAAGQLDHCGTRMDAARAELNCVSLSALILGAYKAEPYQLTGPDWMATTTFDILAKLPDGAGADQVPAMLQALLADRFKLTVRRETKEETVYALLVGKDGLKLKEAAPDAGKSDPPFPGRDDGRLTVRKVATPNGIQTYSMVNGRAVFDAEKISLPELAAVLMGQVEFPVRDMTGLRGFYEVSMDVPSANPRRPGMTSAAMIARSEVSTSSDQPPAPSGVDIFKSVQKLGLVLDRRKAPIERIAVEHLEKTATEN